jgi:mono/diheme cytochrome c family protein
MVASPAEDLFVKTVSGRGPALFAWFATAWILAASLPAQTPLPPSAPAALSRHFRQHCVDCHEGEGAEGAFDLAKLPAKASEQLAVLGRARRRVMAGEMPPPDASDLEEDQRRELLGALETAILSLDAAAGTGPGRVTLRRLSRVEYRRAIRDLFGVVCESAANFPADDLGYGFDNIGDALSTSSLHVEKYLTAAEEVARRTIDTEDPDTPTRRRVQAEFMKRSYDGGGQGDHVNLYKRGFVEESLRLPRAGRYRLRVMAWGDQAGDAAPLLVVYGDGEELARFDVAAEVEAPRVYECEVSLGADTLNLKLDFPNDFYDKNIKDRKRRDRNLRLDWLEIVGPLDRRPPSPGQAWILAADPQASPGKPLAPARRLRPIIEAMGRRIWRRPLKSKESKRLLKLVTAEMEAGMSFREGLRLALEAMLSSPHFLFRIEAGGKSDRKRDGLELDDWQLATRLSFFLWSSVPDERLLELAEKGQLRRPGILLGEATRMLEDDRASALAMNFAAQWLELKNLEVFEPDPERFGTLDDALRRSMRRETESFVLDILRRRAPVAELLTAGYGFLDEGLARHYGIDGVEGAQMRRVEFADERRGGLLSQAAILAVTSNPTRTSIVKRGKWVLENILDAAPPAPPPGADSLGDDTQIDSAASLRERMLAHRAEPACASCHLRMDALGFALEGFDVVGRLRGEEKGAAIDTRGELPDGRVIDGVKSLRDLLALDPSFPVTVAKKLFIYGVGRSPQPGDEVRIAQAVRALGDRPTLHDLVLGIVESRAFRMRSAER